MARCRVYLFTYKRDHLLPKAVKSLLGQTFTNWICEVHNDCPGNTFPADYIAALNDNRFVVIDHPKNLGGTPSFNLAFKNTPEDYFSILEDDNWWEPSFLQEMVQVMDSNPGVSMAWSNMNIWVELENDQWKNTHTTIWPNHNDDIVYQSLRTKQAMGALHSNGAMLCRSKQAAQYVIPDNCEFSIIEGVRERAFPFPIYFSAKVLANFSQTINTSRSGNPLVWTASQMMLSASFTAVADNMAATFNECLVRYRKQSPSPVPVLFLANVFLIKNRSLYKLFNLTDWFLIGKWLLKNLHGLAFLKKYLASQTNTYDFLLKNTRLRYQQQVNKPLH